MKLFLATETILIDTNDYNTSLVAPDDIMLQNIAIRPERPGTTPAPSLFSNKWPTHNEQESISNHIEKA
jgi:hypothetical protein